MYLDIYFAKPCECVVSKINNKVDVIFVYLVRRETLSMLLTPKNDVNFIFIFYENMFICFLQTLCCVHIGDM
jgi:hypothetical protein